MRSAQSRPRMDPAFFIGRAVIEGPSRQVPMYKPSGLSDLRFRLYQNSIRGHRMVIFYLPPAILCC